MIYDAVTAELIIEFDTYTDNTYSNQNNVAYEPLENGSFSSDSKQNSPEFITITARKSISKAGSVKQTVTDIMTTLKELNKGAKLVNIILTPMRRIIDEGEDSFYWQYGETYSNFTLYNFSFNKNIQEIGLVANLQFQEIRLTDTEYAAGQNVASPQDTPVSQQGQIQPTPADSSILNNWFGGS